MFDVASDKAARPTLNIVGAGAGDAAILTLAAADAIAHADVIFVDDLVDATVVAQIPPTAEIRKVGKRGGRPSTPQEHIISELIAAARSGRRVVRLKGGDPMIYARGGEEAEALTAAGINVSIIPGISAAFASASATGIPLTYRNVATQVSFITATRADGSLHPVKGLAGPGRTLVIYMGKSVAAELADALLQDGVSPTLPVAVIENGGRHDQRLEVTSVAALGETVEAFDADGPVLMIVGDVVSKRVVVAPIHSGHNVHFAHG